MTPNKYKKPLERIAQSGTHVKTDDLIFIVEQFVAHEEQKLNNLATEIRVQLQGTIKAMQKTKKPLEMLEHIQSLQSIDNYLENGYALKYTNV